VRRLRDAVDDGFRCPLVPGLKSSREAHRLAEELAFAQTRLWRLGQAPPGLYAEVADPERELEERLWLAVLIALLAPLEGEEDPFATIRAVRVPWASGRAGDLQGARSGPRGAQDPALARRALEAYRAWAARAGSQAAALRGEPSWTPERRFARTYERLALPGFRRDVRFELLSSLGALGVCEMVPAALQLGGSDQATLGAKRALGIGDTMLLERRSAQLAAASGLELAALDLGFYNWERGERATVGLGGGAEPDEGALAAVHAALGL